MTLVKSALVAAAVALAICFKPNVGWSTRVYGPVITGEVTAAPMNGVIEVAHRSYHIKANSAAEKDALSVFTPGKTST